MINEPIRESSPIPHLLQLIITVLPLAGARSKHPKLFGLVSLCDNMNHITLRAYLVQHAHKKMPTLYHILPTTASQIYWKAISRNMSHYVHVQPPPVSVSPHAIAISFLAISPYTPR
jgi:hypothetical protein